jgi:hypothetical protein
MIVWIVILCVGRNRRFFFEHASYLLDSIFVPNYGIHLQLWKLPVIEYFLPY